jgi:hypothetical protein
MYALEITTEFHAIAAPMHPKRLSKHICESLPLCKTRVHLTPKCSTRTSFACASVSIA